MLASARNSRQAAARPSVRYAVTICLGHRPAFGPVLEQLVERRLVGDHGVHQVGPGLRQGEHGDRAAAGPEDRRRAGVEVGQQPGDVVGAHRGVESWSRSSTGLRLMARGSIVTTVWSLGEQVGERGEDVGVHRRTEQQHGRALAADLVVAAGRRDGQVPGRSIVGGALSWRRPLRWVLDCPVPAL